ncbi:hypothetical protein [Anaerosporobacter sp.]|uniref:hypothetical protein n=1 Tax=Anaerosporobacter sp. TaxID=1872529 RepID=UPI00286F8707|nr:hypothetical protein [Anaerosporobacter sp.]
MDQEVNRINKELKEVKARLNKRNKWLEEKHNETLEPQSIIEEEEEFYLDLLSYNTILHCYVIIDLKMGQKE